MKRTIIILLGLLSCMAVLSVIGQKKVLSPKEERREVREKRRAERIANYTKSMDSLVLSRNFQFNPQTMQRQPAGPMRQIMNPEFSVGVWDGTVDVCLPYVKGYVAPYYVTVLNYTLPSVQGYTAEQTHEGWMVTFSSSMFTASTYTFTFEIFTRTGDANLTITNPWYNPVQYTGTNSQLYCPPAGPLLRAGVHSRLHTSRPVPPAGFARNESRPASVRDGFIYRNSPFRSGTEDQRHGRYRHPLHKANDSEPFGGRRLYRYAVHGNPHRLGHRCAHGVDVGAEFRALHADRAVDVSHLVTPLAEQGDHPLQQDLRVDALEIVRRVGEVEPDITQRRGTQQGVAYGMYRHVAVRVGDTSFLMGNLDAPQYQLQPLPEGMHVVSVSDSEIHCEIVSFFSVKVCKKTVNRPPERK